MIVDDLLEERKSLARIMALVLDTPYKHQENGMAVFFN